MSRVAITVRTVASLRTRCECRKRGAHHPCSHQLAAQNSPSPEFPLIDDPEIGGKCPAQLVTQPEARIDIGKPGADETRGVRLAVNIELDLRLQDEPLCQEKVVGGLQPRGEMFFAAYKTGNLQIEEVGGKPLNSRSAS